MLIPLPLSSFFYVWGCSSDGRALALHARGTGIDTPHLHVFLFYSLLKTRYNLYNIHDKKIILIKKRQRQGSNLRSQRETAQQATALTTRPRCLLLYYTDERSTIQTVNTRHTTYIHSKLFLKKRQWQDLNLRIQRIIDFKSIALDHSATLSYTTLLYFPLPDIYVHTIQET